MIEAINGGKKKTTTKRRSVSVKLDGLFRSVIACLALYYTNTNVLTLVVSLLLVPPMEVHANHDTRSWDMTVVA